MDKFVIMGESLSFFSLYIRVFTVVAYHEYSYAEFDTYIGLSERCLAR